MFSLSATLAHWKLDPRCWLTGYLESGAAAGGKAPEDIQPFFPWNLSGERRVAVGAPASFPLRTQHVLTPLAERSAFGMRARTFSIPGEAPP